MHQLRLHAHLRANDEELLEVENLAVIGDVDDLGRIVILDTALDARDIGCRVVESAVGLAHNGERKPLLIEADDKSSVGLFRKPHLDETLDNGSHHVAIEGFAAPRVELHSELGVHPVEFVDGNVDELLPELDIVLIALLELDKLLAASRLPRFVDFRARRGLNVAFLERGDRKIVALLLGEAFAVSLYENAELRTPVAEMVVGDHAIAERTVDAVDGVSDHRGADMPDVHLLGGESYFRWTSYIAYGTSTYSCRIFFTFNF